MLFSIYYKNIIKLTPGIITLLTSRITKVCITGLQAKLRRSRPEAFCKKGVLKNFEKIHRKTPVPESHFLLKKRLWHRYFPVNFGKFLRRYFLTEHLRWLLLYVAFFYLEVATRGVLLRKGVLRNFQKFTGQHLCHSAFFNKVAGMSPAALFRKRLWHRCF